MKTRTWCIPMDTDERMLCAKTVGRAVFEAPEGYEVKISPPSKSNPQRNEFHRLCRAIGDELGYTQGQIKEMFKSSYFGYDEIKVKDKYYRVLRSTEDENKLEYSAMIEGLHQWKAENGI